jgi:hypothetical protein
MKTTALPWARLWLALGALAVAAGALATRPAAAQEDAPAIELASPDALADIVGPIALYPDDLVAIVLPASTYPLQVVQAERFLEERKRNSSLQPDEGWDDSVVALLNYPEVVKLLNDDLDWTYDLGTAVLNQRADVLDAIQAFRDRAYAAGNLRSDDRQTISRADGSIAIKPADPKVIYVPYYEPRRVVVYQTVPVYHYYPWRYPLYYYPYPAGYVFDTGFFWGVRSWFSIGWHSHFLHVYDYGYRAHPYFGWSYYDPWYVRNVYVNVNVGRGYVWEPRHRYGGRPVVRGYEGRVYTSREAPRVNRTGTGSSYRGTAARTSSAPVAGTERRVTRDAGSSTYRSRAAQDGDRSTAGAVRAQPRAGDAAAQTESRTGSGQARETRVYRTPQGGAPGGAGQGSAERSRTGAPSGERSRYSTSERSVTRSAPSRAPSGTTGMPRESTRNDSARSSAPRAQSASPAPRGDGGSRGRADSGSRGSGGGSYRGGGQSSRGEGRTAAR